jgi:hypothetical protein
LLTVVAADLLCLSQLPIYSDMKLVKMRLGNKMEDEFLRDCLISYIEREIALEFTTDTLIDDSDARKK